MLELRQLAVSYGQHPALLGVDLQVAPGEIVVILGANGAGKTSLLKAVAGLVEAGASSQVRLDGRSITGQPPHQRVEAGLALVPEGRGIFGDLSVHENLQLGAFAHRARADQARNLERVLGLFPKLAERSAQLARTMSGGEQQMVAIGRALMSAPTILMLDEPSLGLSPLLCVELFRNLKAVRETGVGILLVEQNARQSLAIADRAYLLENGRITGQGPAEQLARDPAVQAAYLGGAARRQPAAQASAVAAPATANQAVSFPPAQATRTTPADALLPVAVADLVRLAARRQALDLAAQREAAGLPAPLSVTAASAVATGHLGDALARVETAAARVRPAPVVAPTLTVWRRPGITIYRRQADGQLKKDE